MAMSAPVLLACLWVLCATITALLPMRYQLGPGLALLLAAPVLIVWLTHATNLWVGIAATAAFLSMFRKPLRYFAKRAISRMRRGSDGESER